MGREPFTVAAEGGSLGGWLTGSGPPALMLHGGPGLSYDYIDGLGEELAESFRVATFQQRGLEPSTLEGPFTIEQAIADVVAVLDGLGWPRALVVGHSWGGHLALRLIAAHPERLDGVLAVDPLGIVGDGGMAAFEAEMLARTSSADRARARELDQRAMAGEGTAGEALESMRILWPAYFADPEHVAPMPPMRISIDAYSEILEEATSTSREVAAALTSTSTRYDIIAGGGSPIPWGQAARASAELSPTARLTVVPGAGHFVWFEAPGSVLAAARRLTET